MFVKRLIEKYPHVEAKIFIGGSKVGVNPKINNMQPGYAAAKYEMILVSDCGVISEFYLITYIHALFFVTLLKNGIEWEKKKEQKK